MILPKPMLKLLPSHYFDPAEDGILRILSVKEWRDIGITQSMGWEHYEVHAPEPHILLFRREKDFLEKVSTKTPHRAELEGNILKPISPFTPPRV